MHCIAFISVQKQHIYWCAAAALQRISGSFLFGAPTVYILRVVYSSVTGFTAQQSCLTTQPRPNLTHNNSQSVKL